MQTERVTKPTSLKDLAELQTIPEEIAELRQGYEALLQERGKIRRLAPGVLGDIVVGALGERNRILRYSAIIEVEEGKIPVRVFRDNSCRPEAETLIVDVGMRTNNGERVRLALLPDRKVEWIYPKRSLVGLGFPKESPTKNDLKLHSQVLEALRELPVKD